MVNDPVFFPPGAVISPIRETHRMAGQAGEKPIEWPHTQEWTM
jgi:hypothetical protein